MASVKLRATVVLFYFLGIHFCWYLGSSWVVIGTPSTSLAVIKEDSFESLRTHRMKKQTANCSFEEWTCEDVECISADEFCDGLKNCRDGSDETRKACRGFFCPSYLFQCGYGACVNGDARCNGVADCTDGFDESRCLLKFPKEAQHGIDIIVTSAPINRATSTVPLPMSPATTSPSPTPPRIPPPTLPPLLIQNIKQITKYNNEPVQGSILYNDFIKTSAARPMPFRPSIAFEQGLSYFDTSKLPSQKLPPTFISPSIPSGLPTPDPESIRDMCLLPSYPVNGYYLAISGGFPGDLQSFAELSYTCDEGFYLAEYSNNQCYAGRWDFGQPVCERMCEPLMSHHADCCVDGKWDNEIPDCARELATRGLLTQKEKQTSNESEDNYTLTKSVLKLYSLYAEGLYKGLTKLLMIGDSN